MAYRSAIPGALTIWRKKSGELNPSLFGGTPSAYDREYVLPAMPKVEHWTQKDFAAY